jgi:hypothetical protein
MGRTGQIMPTYTNTHSSGSACGIQTTYFFREARALILEELHGTTDDVVLFSGMSQTRPHTRTTTHAPTHPLVHCMTTHKKTAAHSRMHA